MSDESNPATGGSGESSTPPWEDPSLPTSGYQYPTQVNPQWHDAGDSVQYRYMRRGPSCGCLVFTVIVVAVIVGVAIAILLAR